MANRIEDAGERRRRNLRKVYVHVGAEPPPDDCVAFAVKVGAEPKPRDHIAVAVKVKRRR